MILQFYWLKTPHFLLTQNFLIFQNTWNILLYFTSFLLSLSFVQEQENTDQSWGRWFCFTSNMIGLGVWERLALSGLSFVEGWFLAATLLGFLQEFVLLLHSLIAPPSK